MEWLPDNPFVPIVLACVLAAAAFSLLAFVIKSDFVVSAAPPAIFLIGYYATYQKVPPFPPIGSTNKIFYIALLATLGGFVLDRIAVGPLPRAAASLLVSLLAAAWIAYARLDSPDAELIVTGGAVILVGALVLWRVGMIATAAEPEGGGAAALALLAALAAVFAPVALFGGSSTSVGLCLGFAIGLGICSLSLMLAPRSLGSMAVLGAGGGLLAVIDTVVLITGGARSHRIGARRALTLARPVWRPAAAQNHAWVERAGMGSDRNRRLVTAAGDRDVAVPALRKSPSTLRKPPCAFPP